MVVGYRLALISDVSAVTVKDAADLESRAGQQVFLAVHFLPMNAAEGQRLRCRKVLELRGAQVLWIALRGPSVRLERADAWRCAQEPRKIDAKFGEGVLRKRCDDIAVTVEIRPRTAVIAGPGVVQPTDSVSRVTAGAGY